MSNRTRAVVLVVSSFVVACSSSSGSGSGSTGADTDNGGSAGSCKEYTACSMVTSAQVSTAFGATFATGVENDVNKTPSDSAAELVECNYNAPNYMTATVMVRCCPCGDNTPDAVKAEAQILSVVTDVSGIGDTAFWQAPITDAGGLVIDAYTLNVFVGADFYVTVSINNPPAGVDPLDGAKQIAAGVLADL